MQTKVCGTVSFSASNIFKSLKAIYTPAMFLLNFAVAVVYLLLFMLVLKSQGPVAITTAPVYLIYLLVITSSMLITASVYSLLRKTANGKMLMADGVGTIMTFLGGVISGCNCSAPLLFELVVVGLSSSEVVALDNFIAAYQGWILAAMIAVNLLLLAQMLNRISDPDANRFGRKNRKRAR